MKIRRWQCDEIIVADRARKRIKEDAVLELMKSIQRIGLREPPTIRIEVDDDGCEVAILVAGLHRVEACKRLDLKFIDCVEFKGDQAEARLWEIAENLHRAELTALERAEHLNEWRKLTLEKVAQVGPPDGGLQPDDQGIRKTAKEFGTTRQAIQRAMVIDEGMAPEAKEAAKDAGFDDNQAVLLRIGRENTAEDQIAAVRREQERVEERKRQAKPRAAERKRRRLEGNVVSFTPAQSEAQMFAELLMSRLTHSEIPQVISWLEWCKPKDVIAAMRKAAACPLPSRLTPVLH